MSELIRGEKHPLLSARGQWIRACWRSLHQLCEHFTPSDAVIMPDHVHLLLMVNSSDAFSFNPLIFAHWFRKLTATIYPEEQVLARMQASAPVHWDVIDAMAERQLCGVAQVEIIWQKDFWINISRDTRQLSSIRRYIRMNPARYFWKCDHPDLFRLSSHLKHPALDSALPWSAIGDITLLASPFLFLVRLTRKKTLEELEPEITVHLERAKRGGVPICGFISPGERNFEQRLKTLPYTRWIKMVPYGLPMRYDPSVEDSRWISARRLLILSSFDVAHYPPFQITREGCLLMNERAQHIVNPPQS